MSLFIGQILSLINNFLLWRIHLQDKGGTPGQEFSLLLANFRPRMVAKYQFCHRLCILIICYVNLLQRGIDALPGMTILSACLETVSSALILIFIVLLQFLHELH